MSTTDPSRNKPTEAGKNDDPNLRDESAFQPGVSTVSNSGYDDDNQELTKTAADDFREQNDQDPNADRSFDEVDEEH
jgi:hypothetical protein